MWPGRPTAASCIRRARAATPISGRLDPKTVTRRQLTSDPADDVAPSVSPDGRSLAFESNRQGGNRIWIMHIDGSDPRPVSGGPANTVPMWRPDSSAILFVTAISDLWQVDVNGGAERSMKGLWPARSGESAKTFYPRAISRQGVVARLRARRRSAGSVEGYVWGSRLSMGRSRRSCSNSRSAPQAFRWRGPRTARRLTSCVRQ